ncbi:hypothetical protein P5V15_008101 [Pogonomyrmex californicus]
MAFHHNENQYYSRNIFTESVFIDEKNHVDFIEQFVKNVCNFSSQYGSSYSISYTAHNLIGSPRIFPNYGDFPQAFVMRTYGLWWDKAPSKSIDYMPQNNPNVVGQDYIDIEYHEAVYPIRVSIYETFNPGSVIRIWAQGSDQWFQLWSGPPQIVRPVSRIFSPPLKMCYTKIKMIRLEFNHSLLDYYTELDAVLLIGTSELVFPKDRTYKYLTDLLMSTIPICNEDIHNLTANYQFAHMDIDNLKNTLHEHCVIYKSNILENFQLSKLIPQLEQFYYYVPTLKEGCNSMQQFLLKEYSKFIEDIQFSSDESKKLPCGNFSVLPIEVIQRILKYLDLKSLCYMSRVNRYFNNLAQDPLLFTSLNLKPYWNIIDKRLFEFLTPRYKYLRKLDLSWSCRFSNIEIVKFINTCGSFLTHLRLRCSRNITDIVVLEISRTCKNLKELDLGGCSVSDRGLLYLANLQFLERLDLYRSCVTTSTLCEIVRSNPRLRYLLIANIQGEVDIGNVSEELRRHCPNLESVDFWKAHVFTSRYLIELSECKNLREVNFGWCGYTTGDGESFRYFLSSCQYLEKIFLPCFRGLTDRDLKALASCKYLKQLDLVGALSLTADTCHTFFMRCPELEMIDLSYCDNISDHFIEQWRQMYPRVAIKKTKH